MPNPDFDLIVIGAGPGGYVAAIRAAQRGWKVACVEKESALGGTCLRVGCIPSKALLESSELFVETKDKLSAHGIRASGVELDLPAMLRRKDRVVSTLTKGVEGLFKKNKIARQEGHAELIEPGRVRVKSASSETELSARHVIIATGSKPAALPNVPWAGDRIGSSTEALSYPRVPARLVVIGGGYIGLELGSVWRRLGAEVIVLEFLPRILAGLDQELAAEAHKAFEKQGIQFRLGTKVTAARVENEECIVLCEGAEPLRADRVLVAAGRTPNTEGLGLDRLQMKTDSRGRILVDAHFATSLPGVYAIGDVIGGLMLAHKAEEEGVACVEHLVTGASHIDYNSIPAVVYTEPEIASVGRTEEQLNEQKVQFKKGVFPFLANGRARALNKTEGRIKVLADARTDEVLGVHIIGPRAGDLIAEAAAAMAFRATSEDIARVSHAHPTLAEVLKEAALAVEGRAIHI